MSSPMDGFPRFFKLRQAFEVASDRGYPLANLRLP